MKIFLTLLILGQMIMAATLQHIKVNNIEIPIIYEKSEELPIIGVKFVFTNSGSISDEKLAGLAKISAKVLEEGTKKLGSDAFAEALESKAISISTATGMETFNLELDSLKEEFDEGLKYFDMLLKDPNLTQESIQKIKTTTIGKLSSKETDYDYVALNELKSILYKNTPIAKPEHGTISSVQKIELNDVKKFLSEHIVSSRLIVIIGGDISLKEAKQKISKLIKSMRVGNATPVKFYETIKTPKTNILKRDTQQAYIYFGAPFDMKVDSKDYYKAKIANFILGGGFGSRLTEEIRVKRGLAYSAYSRVHVGKSASYFRGYLQTKLSSSKEAQKTIKEVIAKYIKNGVTKDELEQTRKFMLGSEPLRVETMNQKLNRTFMEYYKGQKLGYAKKELELIKNLKLEDLNKFIKSHKEILDLSFAIVTK